MKFGLRIDPEGKDVPGMLLEPESEQETKDLRTWWEWQTGPARQLYVNIVWDRKKIITLF